MYNPLFPSGAPFCYLGITMWISNFTHNFLLYTISRPCSNLNGGITYPPSKLGHQCGITSRCFLSIWLIIHGLILILVHLISANKGGPWMVALYIQKTRSWAPLFVQVFCYPVFLDHQFLDHFLLRKLDIICSIAWEGLQICFVIEEWMMKFFVLLKS